jgi:hypothetical protein
MAMMKRKKGDGQHIAYLAHWALHVITSFVGTPKKK